MAGNKIYSFAWGQNQVMDSMAPAMIDFVEKKSVSEVLEVLDDYGKD